MNVIIVEDEALAAERLEIMLAQYDKNIQVLDKLESVKETIDWFSENDKPDLAFFDIQLGDGSSFEIFEQINVPCPIIFTTAYDAYALKAFQVNSIDYLLKPIDIDDLKGAFKRYEELKANFQKEESENDSLEQIRRAMQMIKKEYKQRFIIKSGSHLSTVQIQDVLFFYSEHKTVWLKHKNGKRHAIDYTLEQLEGLLNPNLFFRLNRKYFASINSIEGAVSYSNSRLKVKLLQHDDDDIVISRERTSSFKNWLDQ